MSLEDDYTTVDIDAWVERARHDPQRYLERQATEVVLAAIGQSELFGDQLYLKGGTLMGLVYDSPRQTVDLDWTAVFGPTDDIEDLLRSALDPELERAGARLGYPQLVCRVQTVRRQPRPDHFLQAHFAALEIKIAYAKRDTQPHRQLQSGRCPTVLTMEVSFHEPVSAVQFVRLGQHAGVSVRAYSLVDVIAEKLRALLQQEIRNRHRRQDVYDIAYLIRKFPPTPGDKHSIHEALLKKARARDIEPLPDSLSDSSVRRRAETDWNTLRLEVGSLPAFDEDYDVVEAFYRGLPWR